MTLRALSVRQPWALSICHGKNVENRSRRTLHRGPVALHASKALDDAADRVMLRRVLDLTGLTREQFLAEDHRGAVIAVMDIVGCHEVGSPESGCTTHDAGGKCSPWAAYGEWHWELDNVRRLTTPVQCRGALGLWRLPDDVDANVRAQLALDGLRQVTQ